MKKDVFELVYFDKEKIVLKVKEGLSTLDIAIHPYINSEMDYITVTRGRDHTMTVVKKDGKTWSVDWGYSGATLCSDSVNALKRAVINYCHFKHQIPLETSLSNDHIKEMSVFPAAEAGKWRLNIHYSDGRTECAFLPAGATVEEAKAFANKFKEVYGWKPGYFPDVQTAIL